MEKEILESNIIEINEEFHVIKSIKKTDNEYTIAYVEEEDEDYEEELGYIIFRNDKFYNAGLLQGEKKNVHLYKQIK